MERSVCFREIHNAEWGRGGEEHHQLHRQFRASREDGAAGAETGDILASETFTTVQSRGQRPADSRTDLLHR